MNKDRTFSEVPVGKTFLMNIAGLMASCVKTSETHIDVTSRRDGRVVSMQAFPAWGPCLYPEEHEEEERRMFAARNRPVVNGHSSSYPYGEH